MQAGPYERSRPAVCAPAVQFRPPQSGGRRGGRRGRRDPRRGASGSAGPRGGRRAPGRRPARPAPRPPATGGSRRWRRGGSLAWIEYRCGPSGSPSPDRGVLDGRAVRWPGAARRGPASAPWAPSRGRGVPPQPGARDGWVASVPRGPPGSLHDPSARDKQAGGRLRAPEARSTPLRHRAATLPAGRARPALAIGGGGYRLAARYPFARAGQGRPRGAGALRAPAPRLRGCQGTRSASSGVREPSTSRTNPLAALAAL